MSKSDLYISLIGNIIHVYEYILTFKQNEFLYQLPQLKCTMYKTISYKILRNGIRKYKNVLHKYSFDF